MRWPNPPRAITETEGLFVADEPGAVTLVLGNLVLLRGIARAPTEAEALDELQGDADRYILGMAIIKKGPRNRCAGAWYMEASAAYRGWGPAVYDAALWYADAVGATGVMPDRRLLSDQAERIWRVYYGRSDIDRRPWGPLPCKIYGRPWLDSVYWPGSSFNGTTYEALVLRGAEYLGHLSAVRGVEEHRGLDAIVSAAGVFYVERLGDARAAGLTFRESWRPGVRVSRP